MSQEGGGPSLLSRMRDYYRNLYEGLYVASKMYHLQIPERGEGKHYGGWGGPRNWAQRRGFFKENDPYRGKEHGLKDSIMNALERGDKDLVDKYWTQTKYPGISHYNHANWFTKFGILSDGSLMAGKTREDFERLNKEYMAGEGRKSYAWEKMKEYASKFKGTKLYKSSEKIGRGIGKRLSEIMEESQKAGSKEKKGKERLQSFCYADNDSLGYYIDALNKYSGGGKKEELDLGSLYKDVIPQLLSIIQMYKDMFAAQQQAAAAASGAAGRGKQRNTAV